RGHREGRLPEAPPAPPLPPNVPPELLRAEWRRAFDAADAALRAANRILPSDENRELSLRLAAEREPTADLLLAYARNQLAAPHFKLPLPPREARRLLGLPREITACVFNLDGVLIGSAVLHAEAWAKTFERVLGHRDGHGHDPAPFDLRRDYELHLHGRPRLQGVRDFLASRGISLPEGTAGDEPGAATVHGLANRKSQVFGRLLAERDLSAFTGAREYLEIARDAHIRCAVVSASAHADTLLERAAISQLIDGRVDGRTLVAEGLRPRPAPDIFLAACRMLGSGPRQTAAFETSPAGISAARAGGSGFVVGVGRGHLTPALREAGADLVVTALEVLREREEAAA